MERKKTVCLHIQAMPVSCFTEVDFDNLSRYYHDKLPRFPNRDHGELLRTDPYHGLSVQSYRVLEGGYSRVRDTHKHSGHY